MNYKVYVKTYLCTKKITFFNRYESHKIQSGDAIVIITVKEDHGGYVKNKVRIIMGSKVVKYLEQENAGAIAFLERSSIEI